MHAYIINLDSAPERWRFVESNFSATGIPFTRISGVDGRQLQLPIPEYSEAGYIRWGGSRTNVGQIGCYLSHLKSLRTFLESPHEIAIIAEDDALPTDNLRELIERACLHKDSWDILRLCGIHNAHPVRFAPLTGDYHLCTCFTRLCGTGAYVVTRHAAAVLLDQLVPMRLPIDHAIDREWVYGLRAAAIMPLPVSQKTHAFPSQTQAKKNDKLPWYRHFWTVFPWKVGNESGRVLQRSRQLRQARLAARERADLLNAPLSTE